MSAPSRLRIAVIGAGNIGSTFAFQLARAGHALTVIARPDSARLAQLRQAGGIVDVRGMRADVIVAAALDEAVAYELVIVTVLAHQVDALLPALTRSAARHLLFVFNQFDPGRLATALGVARCDFGMPFVQARIDRSGRLDATIGAGGQKTKLGSLRWVELFNAAGLPAVHEPRIKLWLRCHVPLCIAFESVCVLGVRRDGGARWSEAMALARGMRQGFAVIRGLGDAIYPTGKARLAGSPLWVGAAMLWTVSRIKSFRTLLATGAAECRALVDVMAAAARAATPPLDVAELVAMKPGDEVLPAQ